MPDRDEWLQTPRAAEQSPCCSTQADTEQTIKMCCSAAVGGAAASCLASAACSLGAQGAMSPAAVSILSNSQRFKVNTWTKVVR